MINNKAIGILGGTFDPIHTAHLRMAIELQENFGLEKVHLIPCYQPVHRKLPVASPEERLNMVACAVKDEKKLIVDSREITREKPSYTIDTLIEMRKEMPNTPFALLIGMDAFLSFLSWNRWVEIFNYAHLIVAHRPQYQLPSAPEMVALVKKRFQENIDYLHKNLAGGIFFHPITPLEISASEIRKLIFAGKDARYLLPNCVYEYIKQHGIYSISGYASHETRRNT